MTTNTTTKTGSNEEEMYVPQMDAVVNRWFTTYEEARASLAERGGYLLPFRNQFFITESEGVRELGLDPADADWELIGWDWVQPKNRDAWERLRKQREKARSSG